MTRFPKEITENGIHYTLRGDYYFPDLALPESSRHSLGRYGRMRSAYLKGYRPGLYERLLLSGKLYDHLAETDACCSGRMDLILRQMAAAAAALDSRRFFCCRVNKTADRETCPPSRTTFHRSHRYWAFTQNLGESREAFLCSPMSTVFQRCQERRRGGAAVYS